MTLSTREADAAFADVVYADQQWVDAEFDALISASFSEPPAPPPPAPPRVPPQPGNPSRPSRQLPSGPAAVTYPATGPDHGRQRSPPAHPLAGPGPPPLPPERAAARDSKHDAQREGGQGADTIELNLRRRRAPPAEPPPRWFPSGAWFMPTPTAPIVPSQRS